MDSKQMYMDAPQSTNELGMETGDISSCRWFESYGPASVFIELIYSLVGVALTISSSSLCIGTCQSI